MNFLSYYSSAASLVLGLVGGGLVGWRLRVRRQVTAVIDIDDSPVMDSDLEQDIEMAAASWAEANGRPELSDLLSRKVKLAWKLRYGDDPSGW